MEEVKTPNVVNGVNLDNVMGLVEHVKSTPEAANVKFMAKSTWGGATKADVKVTELLSDGNCVRGGQKEFNFSVDEPACLGGEDNYANPVEHLLAALCGCLTAGIATNAALNGIELEKINVDVDANWDLHGVLGLNKETPRGALDLHYKVTLKGKEGTDAEQVKISKLKLDRMSPIKNTLELPLNITTDVEVL